MLQVTGGRQHAQAAITGFALPTEWTPPADQVRLLGPMGELHAQAPVTAADTRMMGCLSVSYPIWMPTQRFTLSDREERLKGKERGETRGGDERKRRWRRAGVKGKEEEETRSC
ncbi:unnamed protein product [Pleuronectes platessa]|uniref:Uncharacterized protein n=1 Tax=Pleuronectes platessa TaxID=8262 RepID=A0A9N7YP81_PLEPL|nr:unnamed protein product [Pleuronectes platessa]